MKIKISFVIQKNPGRNNSKFKFFEEFLTSFVGVHISNLTHISN